MRTAAGTITKRKLANGRVSWGYSFFAGRGAAGERIQAKRSGFTTRAEASAALDQAMSAHAARMEAGESAAAPPAPEKTFAEFVTEWLDTHAARSVTPLTLQQYRHSAGYLTRSLGELPLKSVTPRLLEKTLYELLERGGRDREGNARPLAAKTVRHAAFVLNGAYETAFRLEEIDANPLRRVKLPKLEKRELAVLSRDEVSRLLAAAEGTRLHPLIVLALASGCRRGELLALTWENLDLDTGLMTISVSIEQTKDALRLKGTKSGKTRRVYLPESALCVLRAYRCEYLETQEKARMLFGTDYQERNLVFCRPDGDFHRPDRISSGFCELARKVGLKIGLHSLRHQHASEALSAGAPLPAVAARLGHASAAITGQIYAHVHQDDERRIAQKWNSSFGSLISGNIRRI